MDHLTYKPDFRHFPNTNDENQTINVNVSLVCTSGLFDVWFDHKSKKWYFDIISLVTAYV